MNDSKKYKMLTCPKGHVYSDMFDFCPECNRPKMTLSATLKGRVSCD